PAVQGQGSEQGDEQPAGLPEYLELGGSRKPFESSQGALDLFLLEGEVLEVAGEIVVVGGHVEVAEGGEVEENRPLLARLVGSLRRLQRAVDRVRRLRRGDDALVRGEEDGGGEDVVLEIGLRADEPVADELRDERRGAVVAQASR